MLVLVVSFHPAHAGSPLPAQDRTAVAAMPTDGGSGTQDAAGGHVACQCGCQIAPLPIVGQHLRSTRVVAAWRSMADQPSVLASDAGLPTRPPRS